METVAQPITEWCPKCNHGIQYEGDAAFCLCTQRIPQGTHAKNQTKATTVDDAVRH